MHLWLGAKAPVISVTQTRPRVVIAPIHVVEQERALSLASRGRGGDVRGEERRRKKLLKSPPLRCLESGGFLFLGVAMGLALTRANCTRHAIRWSVAKTMSPSGKLGDAQARTASRRFNVDGETPAMLRHRGC